MIRVSDARMSGTAYGTVILHGAPEAAAGGPLGLVQDGDMIEVDVAARRIHLDVSDAEMDRRRTARATFANPYDRGYSKLYVDPVNQADKGADLDFLLGKPGPPARRERDRKSAGAGK